MLELFHRGELFGATADDFDQLAIAHAPHQRLAAAARQTFTSVVKSQPRIAQRRRTGGEARMPGQRVHGQHRFRCQLRATQLAKDLRQRHPGGQPTVRQAVAQAPAMFMLERRQLQPARFFSRSLERPQRGALDVEIPQLIEAQQSLTVRQCRQQALAAVGIHLPTPVQLMRLAAR